MPIHNITRKGFQFSSFKEEAKSAFDRLFDIFKELITHTSGDFDEAMDWMKTLDKEYKLTDEEYSMDDFINELKERGYIKDEIKPDGKGKTTITAKTEGAIRKNALEQIYDVAADYSGYKYCGLFLKWNYVAGYVDVAMPFF